VQIPQVEVKRLDQATDFGSACENKYVADNSCARLNNSSSEKYARGSRSFIRVIKSRASCSISAILILNGTFRTVLLPSRAAETVRLLLFERLTSTLGGKFIALGMNLTLEVETIFYPQTHSSKPALQSLNLIYNNFLPTGLSPSYVPFYPQIEQLIHNFINKHV